MTADNARPLAFVAGMLTVVAADGVNWLVTPHADASSARQIGVVLQVIVCAAVAWWCWRRSGRVAPAAGSAP